MEYVYVAFIIIKNIVIKCESLFCMDSFGNGTCIVCGFMFKGNGYINCKCVDEYVSSISSREIYIKI